MVCASLDGRVVWGRKDTRIRTVKSLRCLPETTTTLLIGYAPTPIQNKKKIKVYKKKKMQKKKKDSVGEQKRCHCAL